MATNIDVASQSEKNPKEGNELNIEVNNIKKESSDISLNPTKDVKEGETLENISGAKSKKEGSILSITPIEQPKDS